MSRHEYAALPTRRDSLAATAAAEMDSAFDESDDEDHQHESTPLAQPVAQSSDVHTPQTIPGAYDFERDYDYPPPGSPPRPSARALPNAVGNSNGFIPSPSTVQTRFANSNPRGPSFLRRAVGALLPSHYARVPTGEAAPATHARGGGMENDGVFANVMAKPTPPRAVQDEAGDVYVMPEEAQKDAPPTYAAAQADAVPPYWETTIHAPHVGGLNDDMIIDGLQSGSYFSFAWNLLISISFQFIGFMLTYLLHTTHAAKYGSRAGLGVTLIQYGLYSKESESRQDYMGDEEVGETSLQGGAMSPVHSLVRRGGALIGVRSWGIAPVNGTAEDTMMGQGFMGTSTRDWIALLLMTLGWLLLLTSFLGFLRVKRWESSVRAAANPEPPLSAEAIARDRQVRENLQRVFGFGFDEEEEEEGEDDGGRRAMEEPNSGGEGGGRSDWTSLFI